MDSIIQNDLNLSKKDHHSTSTIHRHHFPEAGASSQPECQVVVSPSEVNHHMGVSYGDIQQPWFFLLKMIILGKLGGTTI